MKLMKLYGIVLLITIVVVVGCGKDERVIDDIVSTIATDSQTLYEVCTQLRPEIDNALAEHYADDDYYPDSLGWRKVFIVRILDNRLWRNFYIHVYYGDERFDYLWIEKADIDSVRSMVPAGMMIRFRDWNDDLAKDDIIPMHYVSDIFVPSNVTVDTTYKK